MSSVEFSGLNALMNFGIESQRIDFDLNLLTQWHNLGMALLQVRTLYSQ